MEKRQLLSSGLGLFIITYVVFGSFYKPTSKNWTNVVRQTNSYSCGYCCLKMVFNHYNIQVNNRNMLQHVINKHEGSSLLLLKKYAEAKGLSVQGRKYIGNNLPKTTNVSIILIDKAHFVILDSIKNNTIYIRDPINGNIALKSDKFLARWNKFSLTFSKSKIL